MKMPIVFTSTYSHKETQCFVHVLLQSFSFELLAWTTAQYLEISSTKVHKNPVHSVIFILLYTIIKIVYAGTFQLTVLSKIKRE